MALSRIARCNLLLATCALFSAGYLAAQDQIPTLHVDATLVQIPALVLTPNGEEYAKTIAPRHFSIRLGDGQWMAPKFVRPEGEDPIDLAVVLDTRSAQSDLLPKMPALLESLTRSSLRPRDHVSVYAMRCGTLQASVNVPAVPETVRLAANTTLADAMQRGAGASHGCKTDVRLWDTLAYISQALSARAGRRVILALTSGDDRGSSHSANDLKKEAQNDAVTLFGFDAVRHPLGGASWNSRNPSFWSPGEISLGEIAEATGGVSLNLEADDPALLLKRFMQMVRGRYILEFSRPATGPARELIVDVRLDDRAAFIRLGGDSIPRPNAPSTAEAREPASTAPIASVPEQPAVPTIQLAAQPAPVAELPALPTPPPPLAQVPAPLPQLRAAAPDTEIESQQPGNSPQADVPTPTLRITTRLTVENVIVSDSHRRPVHGLLQSDFELREDGKLQTIRNFAEYGSGSTSTEPAGNGHDAASQGNGKAGAIDLILLDSMSTGLSNRLAMSPENFAVERQQSIKFLHGLPGGTRVAILQLGDGVQLLQNVTEDKAALLAAMDAARYKSVAGTTFTPLTGPFSGNENQSSACDAANTQSRLTIAALQQLAEILSTAPGRKNVMWFTPGTPWLTRYIDFSSVSCLTDYTSELRRAYNQLNAAQIALYPIDPRGLVADPTLAIAASPAGIMATRESGRVAAQSLAAFNVSLSAEHGALTDLAAATGGTAYYNRNDLDAALGEAISSANDYYSLAYIPPLSQSDGKFHTIGVKVDHPKVELHYREGYFAVSPAKALK